MNAAEELVVYCAWASAIDLARKGDPEPFAKALQAYLVVPAELHDRLARDRDCYPAGR